MDGLNIRLDIAEEKIDELRTDQQKQIKTQRKTLKKKENAGNMR